MTTAPDPAVVTDTNARPSWCHSSIGFWPVAAASVRRSARSHLGGTGEQWPAPACRVFEPRRRPLVDIAVLDLNQQPLIGSQQPRAAAQQRVGKPPMPTLLLASGAVASGPGRAMARSPNGARRTPPAWRTRMIAVREMSTPSEGIPRSASAMVSARDRSRCRAPAPGSGAAFRHQPRRAARTSERPAVAVPSRR